MPFTVIHSHSTKSTSISYSMDSHSAIHSLGRLSPFWVPLDAGYFTHQNRMKRKIYEHAAREMFMFNAQSPISYISIYVCGRHSLPALRKPFIHLLTSRGVDVLLFAAGCPPMRPAATSHSFSISDAVKASSQRTSTLLGNVLSLRHLVLPCGLQRQIHSAFPPFRLSLHIDYLQPLHIRASP